MSRRDDDETVLVDNLRCVAATAKAICVTVGTSTKEIWIPRSQIRGGNIDKAGDQGSIEMIAWIHDREFDGMATTSHERQTGEERTAAAAADPKLAEHVARLVRAVAALTRGLEAAYIVIADSPADGEVKDAIEDAVKEAKRAMSTDPVEAAAERQRQARAASDAADEKFALAEDEPPF